MKEDNIWITQLEKPSGSEGFMKPLFDLVNGNPARALDDFHIIALMKHRDPEHLDEEETMKQGEGSHWPWLVLICFRETEETTEEFGNWLAEQLSLFANKPDSGYLGNKNLLICHSSGCWPWEFLLLSLLLTKANVLLIPSRESRLILMLLLKSHDKLSVDK